MVRGIRQCICAVPIGKARVVRLDGPESGCALASDGCPMALLHPTR
jgi:hypothetical protein